MEEIKAIHVTINDDGTTSNGSPFSAIDDENFYLDHIKYTVKEGRLIVSGYDEDEFSGTANIVSSLTYKGNTYEVLEVRCWAFKGCDSLTSVIIPEGVTSIEGSAFKGCSSLTSINIPEGVTSIGHGAFFKCSSLTSVNIPEGVTSIGENVFSLCSSLTSVNIPEGVKKIEKYTFDGCSSLTSITIPKSVRKIGEFAFKDCSALTSIDITKSVKNIEYGAFQCCSSLTSIDLPGVTSIGDFAFSHCSSLTSITIPKSTKKIESEAFAMCSSLASITVSEGNPVYDSRENCNAIIETASNKLIAGCQGTIIPEGVTSIDYKAFRGTSLMSIVIPASVTSIRDSAFEDCSSLTSISLSNGVTSIGNRAFCDCSSLTSIVIPEGVTSIGYSAFDDCSSLTSITIPESLTSIGKGAFGGCSSLTSMTVSEGNPVYASRENCNAIIETASNTLIVVSQGSIIPEGVTSIGHYAFAGRSSLTSIVIPDGVTSIGDHAFEGCSSLTSITIPEGVTSIGDQAFAGCSSLTSIVIPESVTRIEGSAFKGVPKSEATLYVPASALEYYKTTGLGKSFGAILPIEEDTIKSTNQEEKLGLDIKKMDFSVNKKKNMENNQIKLRLSNENIQLRIDENAFDAKLLSVERDGLEMTLNFENPIKKIEYQAVEGEGLAYSSQPVLDYLELPETLESINGRSFPFPEAEKVKCTLLSSEGFFIKDKVLLGAIVPKSATEVVVPEGIETIGPWAFPYEPGSGKCVIILPKSVRRIEHDAFNRTVRKVKLPKDLEYIGDRAFYEPAPPSIAIPDKVKYIGEFAFADSYRINSIKLGKGVETVERGAFADDNTPSVKKMSGPFASEDEKALVFKGTLLRYATKDLNRSLTLPDGIETIDTGAIVCRFKPPVNLPSTLKCIREKGICKLYSSEYKIPESVVHIEEGAFYCCHIDKFKSKFADKTGQLIVKDSVLIAGSCEIEELVVPSSVSRIGKFAMSENTNLKAIKFHSGIKAIGEEAFVECKGLSGDLVLNQGLEEIGEYAFTFHKYSSITIPSSIKSISPNAFGGSYGSKIKDVYILSDNPFNWDMSGIPKEAEIHVPESSIEAFRTAYPERADMIKC